MKKLGIYVHIPFCVRKCAYCDFLSFEGKSDKQGPYIGALNREVDIMFEKFGVKDNEEYVITSIYFGGGTPTSIKESYVCDLLCKLIQTIETAENLSFAENIEITLEANPGTLSMEKLIAYKEAGFNRLSIGLQSADNAELNFLSRIHTFEEFKENFLTAYEVGFRNINVDIMTALPYQGEYNLNHTLDELFELSVRPTHISAYSLIVEKGTDFYDKFGERNEDGKYTGPMGSAMPSEAQERELYYLVRNRLLREGYMQYEISNFAYPGFESIHNSAYWSRQDYIGLGLGASSLVNNVRLKNESDLDKYIENPKETVEKITLDTKAQMEEFMFLGLRRIDGVSTYEFTTAFSKSMESVYDASLKKLIGEGLMYYDGGRYALTDVGIDYGNYCFSQFLLV
ncbi:MAG: radical SAM family heme chaperone HemW [Lachnospiraceae bacterium]|nr:radical SAM family heme chaperone HemW [Lachnospiraceae bacterium]